ncbi:unnamed protein product, partial [Phaeothamnion confervicola]
RAVGEFQSRLLLTTMYFFILPLFSLMARGSGDPLGLKGFRAQRPHGWLQRPQPGTDLESARQQF